MVSAGYLLVFFLLGVACGIGVGVKVNEKSDHRSNNDRK